MDKSPARTSNVMSAPTPSSFPGPDEPGPEDDHAWLSALADGDRDALDRATALWRTDAGARERWHVYHLIGDVMRSEELAARPERDADFVLRLRARLSKEPVPLAPSAVNAAPSPARNGLRRLGWRAPAAVAAGVATVAVALMLVRPADGLSDAKVAGDPSRPASGAPGATTRGTGPVAGPQLAGGDVIRDARLDAFIRAHEEARGVAPAALPGGGLRKAEIVVIPIPSSPFAPASR